MTWIKITTKPDELIQLNSVLFQNVYSTTVPTSIIVTKGTLTGTALSGYNVVLTGVTLTGNTIKQSSIQVNSNDAKVQFVSFNFNGNIISGSYPSIQFTTWGSWLVQDSQFSNNLGSMTAQDFYWNGYNSGNIQFINTVFTGKGLSTYSDPTNYNMYPSMLIVNCVNIAFTGWTFSGYPKSAFGGAIKISGSTVTFTSTTIKDNRAKAGGAMLIESISTVTLNSWTITGNQAEDAGAISVIDRSILIMSSCTISGNTAKSGGAFQFMMNSRVSDSKCFISLEFLLYLNTIGKSTIQGNTATVENSVALFANSLTDNVFDGTNILSNKVVGSST